MSFRVFRVPSKINGDWFNPNTSLVKSRIRFVLFARFSTHWKFKESLSYSLIRIWRKFFSMSAHQITCLNLVLIRMSHNLFWRDDLFQTPRLWFGWSIIYCSQFCWLSSLSNYWSMWQEEFFWISLWFSETFSITLFTNWSLITWSYALNISGFCSSRFKSDFTRPRLPDFLLFKGILFSVHTRPVSYHPPSFLSSCYLNFLYTFWT